MPTPLQRDAARFLAILIDRAECSRHDHDWQTCRRCLAHFDLESGQRFAVRFVKEAIRTLKNAGENE